MTDDTTPASEAGESETTMLDTAKAEAAPLAWSTEPEPEVHVVDDRPSWRQPIAISVLVLAVSAIVAANAGWLLHHPPAPPALEKSALPPSVAMPAPPTVAAPPVTVTAEAAPPTWQTQENQFLALVRLDGTYDGIIAHGGAGHARLLCDRLEAGLTHLTDHEDRPTLYDIVDVYCPDFDPRGADAVARNVGRAAADDQTAIPAAPSPAPVPSCDIRTSVCPGMEG